MHTTGETGLLAESGCEAAEVEGQQAPFSHSSNVPLELQCA